ncbi:MAG: nucleotidyltransferase family protein, partial [Anaeroplasmataceae bacterium]|nr:nucleotidyltransferase family protein [Anaeroplasmataceae bacterium]
YILFNISKQKKKNIKLDFLRILGYSNQGKAYLNTIKKDVSIFTNIKEGLHPILDIELKITKLLDMIYSTSTLNQEQGKPQEI